MCREASYSLSLGVREETGCVLETALVAGRISFSIHYAEGARRKRNGHPFLRVQGRVVSSRIDKYLAFAVCRFASFLASSTPSTSFLILTTPDHSATKLPLYFLQLSLRDTSYYLLLQASLSYPPIAAYNSTSY